MTQRLPVPELFINEDVSKPENRTNLALFGVLLVPGVRAWLLERLALPADSIVYPPQNVAGGRPDFVVVGPDDTVVGWIEVELGGEDQGQLVQYRARHAEPVRSIVGPKSAGGDLSLEEIADVLSGPRFQGLDRQQTTNVGVFIALVGAMAGRPASFAYADPTEEVRGRRLVRALRDGLGSMLQYGTPPVTPGTAQVSTITQKGWTLKVYSKAASGGNVTLFGTRPQAERKSACRRGLACSAASRPHRIVSSSTQRSAKTSALTSLRSAKRRVWPWRRRRSSLRSTAWWRVFATWPRSTAAGRCRSRPPDRAQWPVHRAVESVHSVRQEKRRGAGAGSASGGSRGGPPDGCPSRASRPSAVPAARSRARRRTRRSARGSPWPAARRAGDGSPPGSPARGSRPPSGPGAGAAAPAPPGGRPTPRRALPPAGARTRRTGPTRPRGPPAGPAPRAGR